MKLPIPNSKQLKCGVLIQSSEVFMNYRDRYSIQSRGKYTPISSCNYLKACKHYSNT